MSRPRVCIWLISPSYSGLLDRLVDSGKSVVVIEHHQAVMAHADWIIDLAQVPDMTAASCLRGNARDLVADRKTLTGQHLATYVGAWSRSGVRRRDSPGGSAG